MSARILVVDDEPAIREMIRFVLDGEGFETLEAGLVDEARRQIVEHDPDLVLLDLMLPGRSGLEYVRQLRQDKKTRDLPVIMLTARAEEADKVKGFELGADDYITKPFSPRELIARINAVLRRSIPPGRSGLLGLGGLRMDVDDHRVTVDGKVLEIPPTEFRLLQFFLSNQERVHSRASLLDKVWGEGVFVEERTVDVHIRRLRKLLEPGGYDSLIQTVRGVGYRLSSRR